MENGEWRMVNGEWRMKNDDAGCGETLYPKPYTLFLFLAEIDLKDYFLIDSVVKEKR